MINDMRRRDENGNLRRCTLVVPTCNRKLGTGGERLKLSNCSLIDSKDYENIAKTANEADILVSKKIIGQRHLMNKTINVKDWDGNRLITIHPILVERYNGEYVGS